jgi:hypothetical protein
MAAGTVEIMRRSGKAKPAVWTRQARFMADGVGEGCLRYKTRKPGKPQLSTDTVQRVVDLALGPPPTEPAGFASLNVLECTVIRPSSDATPTATKSLSAFSTPSSYFSAQIDAMGLVIGMLLSWGAIYGLNRYLGPDADPTKQRAARGSASVQLS